MTMRGFSSVIRRLLIAPMPQASIASSMASIWSLVRCPVEMAPAGQRTAQMPSPRQMAGSIQATYSSSPCPVEATLTGLCGIGCSCMAPNSQTNSQSPQPRQRSGSTRAAMALGPGMFLSPTRLQSVLRRPCRQSWHPPSDRRRTRQAGGCQRSPNRAGLRGWRPAVSKALLI